MSELRELSILDEEFDRLKEEVWFVLTRVFAVARAASTLEDEFERLRLDV